MGLRHKWMQMEKEDVLFEWVILTVCMLGASEQEEEGWDGTPAGGCWAGIRALRVTVQS